MNSSRIMNGRTTGALPSQNTKIDKVVPLVIDELQRGPHVVSKGQEVRISVPANYSLSGFPRAVKKTEKIESPMGGPARKIITFKAISGDVKLSFKDPESSDAVLFRFIAAKTYKAKATQNINAKLGEKFVWELPDAQSPKRLLGDHKNSNLQMEKIPSNDGKTRYLVTVKPDSKIGTIALASADYPGKTYSISVDIQE